MIQVTERASDRDAEKILMSPELVRYSLQAVAVEKASGRDTERVFVSSELERSPLRTDRMKQALERNATVELASSEQEMSSSQKPKVSTTPTDQPLPKTTTQNAESLKTSSLEEARDNLQACAQIELTPTRVVLLRTRIDVEDAVTSSSPIPTPRAHQDMSK